MAEVRKVRNPMTVFKFFTRRYTEVHGEISITAFFVKPMLKVFTDEQVSLILV